MLIIVFFICRMEWTAILLYFNGQCKFVQLKQQRI